MKYKYSEDYDEILDIDCDIEFIKNFLANSKDINVAQSQLKEIYELEYEKNKSIIVKKCLENNSTNETGFELARTLLNRNEYLIYRYAFDFIKGLDLKVYKEICEQYEEVINRNHTSCILLSIFEMQQNNSILFDRKRDIELYRKKLREINENKQKVK